ncbi:MAG: RNA polymerase sigma-70 factor [Bacteroidetes bacterium]|nr:RNA polymerase sigma-70 factor [Bacteroidota bacterium]
MRSIPDEQFLRWSHGLLRSDATSYAELFDASYDALHRYALYIMHDDAAASDILQDVYLKLWQVRETIDPERSLRALMYQMVRNYALNHERQRKRHAAEAIEADHPSVGFDSVNDDELDAAVLKERLQIWIDEMPERRREAFMLSRFEGLSHDEIASLMDLAPKTVNNHIVLALQHIRKKLDAFRDTESYRSNS